jgi:hypothetical protein
MVTWLAMAIFVVVIGVVLAKRLEARGRLEGSLTKAGTRTSEKKNRSVSLRNVAIVRA